MTSEPDRTARPESQTDPAPDKKEAETLDGTFPPEAAALIRRLQLSLDPPTVDHVPNTLANNPAPPPPADPVGTVAASPSQDQRSAERSGVRGHPLSAGLPGYELLEVLGQGGMGVVYKARETTLKRVVALKVLKGDRADEKTLSRFLIEAEAVAALKHPNVVQVLHYGESGGWPYMTLDYCPGGTLAARLQGGRLPPVPAADLVRKIAAGVAAAHAQDIVHRDLKPGNVLFDAAGEPKVADFGLAKLAVGADLTVFGDVMGTPSYMAPEQAGGGGKTAGPQADVWALGVILYECLTGTRPFAGEGTQNVLAAVQRDAPVPFRRHRLTLPRDLQFVCLKCLRKDPRDRYADAAELAAELGRYLNGEALGGRRREWGYRAKKALVRWRVRIGVGAFLLACLAGMWWVGRYHAPEAQRPPDPPAPQEDPALKVKREEVARRVEALSRTPPRPDRAPPHAVNHVPELARPDHSAFQLDDDDRVVDLRGWRPLPPGDPEAECFIINNVRQVWTKLRPADVLRTEARTTGRDVVMRAVLPNPDRAKLFVSDKRDVVGGQVMKVRQLAHDVADVPVGNDFTVQTRSTFWNSLQTDGERWFGVVGSEGSVLTSMLMIFPHGHPYKDFTLRVAPTRNAPPEAYTGPVVTFQAEDRRWLYWEIPNPKAGHVYRVDWTW